MSDAKQPNLHFIGVGAARSGTTWISQCLKEHPEICLSSPKETHFFDRLKPKGATFSDYASFFTHCDSGQIQGEFTPAYFLYESIAREIREAFPDVKILVSLRNPVERAFSHYLYDKHRFGRPRTLEEAIEGQSRVVTDGLYYKHLRRFLPYFDDKQVLVLIYEDALANPRAFIQRIYRFLGVDDAFVPRALVRRTNMAQTTAYRLPWLNRAIRSIQRDILSLPGGRYIHATVHPLGIGKKLQRINRRAESYSCESLGAAANKTLRNFYIEDINRLGQMLGRDLSHWREE